MNTLPDIVKYYYYIICILWFVLTFVTVRNNSIFRGLSKKAAGVRKMVVVGYLFVLVFYNCLPISFFYFDRFEYNKLGLQFTSVWGFPLYKTNSVNFRYRIDTYSLSNRTGGSTERQRIVIEVNGSCFHSHILTYQSGVQRFINSTSPENQQAVTCLQASSVETDMTILRALLGLILTVFGAIVYKMK